MRLAKSHPTWVVGFADEVWWSRLAQPEQHRWVGETELTRLQELERAKDDGEAKALACYGVVVRRADAVPAVGVPLAWLQTVRRAVVPAVRLAFAQAGRWASASLACRC